MKQRNPAAADSDLAVERRAADPACAGIGETVLLTTGSSARLALQNQNAPVDAVIVGIVD